MPDWKKYTRFKVIHINEWGEGLEKDAWEIIEFFPESYNTSSSTIQNGHQYTIQDKTEITFPVSATSNYSGVNFKFLIGQHKTHDVLFKKE